MAPEGFRLYPAWFDTAAQADLRDQVFALAEASPFYCPITPGGQPMSVRMTNFGTLGWVTDASGYRYQARHPLTGRPWPAMPAALLELWRAVGGVEVEADCCLANVYRGSARMSLHQDRDEADFAFPVVSVSLGDTAIFRIGGTTRGGPTSSVRLSSGDVCVLSGPARLAFHGVDRVIAGSSRLIEGGGRLNLTLRRAAPAPVAALSPQL
jgi:alkylated DNA repair protein (DNA oxidative demethylase)